MKTINIPQTAIVTSDGKLTAEWLVFINEVVRQLNKLDDEKADKVP